MPRMVEIRPLDSSGDCSRWAVSFLIHDQVRTVQVTLEDTCEESMRLAIEKARQDALALHMLCSQGDF